MCVVLTFNQKNSMKLLPKYFIFICLALFTTNTFVLAKNTQKKSVPVPVLSFIDKHFKDMELEKIKYDEKDDEYKVKFKNGYEIEFDSNDNWIKIETDFHPLPKSVMDLLPANIMKYIARHYPNRTITKIKCRTDDYRIKLSGSPDLLFDKQGVFIRKK